MKCHDWIFLMFTTIICCSLLIPIVQAQQRGRVKFGMSIQKDEININPSPETLPNQARPSPARASGRFRTANQPAIPVKIEEENKDASRVSQRGSRGRSNDRSSRKLTAEATEAIPVIRSRKRVNQVPISDQPTKVQLPTSSINRTNIIRRNKSRPEAASTTSSPSSANFRTRSDIPSDGLESTESVRKVRTFTSRSVTKQADEVFSSAMPLTVATTSSNWRNVASKRGSAKAKFNERKSKSLDEDQLEDENYPEHFKLLLKKQQPSPELLPKNYPKLTGQEDPTYSKLNEVYEAPKVQARLRRVEETSKETSDEILQVSRAIPKVRRVELKREDTARAALKTRRVEPRQDENVETKTRIVEPLKSRRSDVEKLRSQVKTNKEAITSRRNEPLNEVKREDTPKVPSKPDKRTETLNENNANDPEVKPNEIEEATKSSKSLFLPRRAEPYRPKPKTTTQRPTTTSKPIKKPDALDARAKFKNRLNSRLQFPSLKTRTSSEEGVKDDNEVVHTSPVPKQVRPLQITKSRHLAFDKPIVDTRSKSKPQKFSSRYRGDAFSRYQEKTEPSKPIYTPTIPALTTEPAPRQLDQVTPYNLESHDLKKSGSKLAGVVYDESAGVWNMVEPVAGGLTRSEISVDNGDEQQQQQPQSVTVSIFEALADILSKTPTTTTSTSTTTTTTTSTTELPDIIQVPDLKIDSISSTTVNTHDPITDVMDDENSTTTNEIITDNDRDGRLLNSVEINPSTTTITPTTLSNDPINEFFNTVTVPKYTSDTTLLSRFSNEQTTPAEIIDLTTLDLPASTTLPTPTNIPFTNLSINELELTILSSNLPTSLPLPILANALTTPGSSLITQPQLISAISNILDTSVQNASDTMAISTTNNNTTTAAILDTNSTPPDASTTLPPPITTTFTTASTESPPVTISFLDLFTIQAKKVSQNTEPAVEVHPIYKGPEPTTTPAVVEKQKQKQKPKQPTGMPVNINTFFRTQTYPSISVAGSTSTDRAEELSNTFRGVQEEPVTDGVTTDTNMLSTSTIEQDTSTLDYTTSPKPSIRTQSLPIHLNSILGSTQKYEQTSPFKTVQTEITTTIRSRFGNRRIPILPAGSLQSTTSKISKPSQTSSTTPVSTTTTTTTVTQVSPANKQELSNVTTTTTTTELSSKTKTEQTPIQDFSVYGILPNNTVIRKRPPQVSRKLDIGIMVYGILPNQTVVRKYPNGTLMIVDSSQDVEVIDIDPKMLFNPFSELYRTSQSSLLLTTHRSTTSHRLIESNHILSSSSSSSSTEVPDIATDGSGRKGNSIKETTETGNTDSTLSTNTDDENLIQWLSENEDNILNSTSLIESNTENAVLLDLLKRKYIKSDLPSRSSNVVSLTTVRNHIEETSLQANKGENVSENTLFDSSEEKKKDSAEDLFLTKGVVMPSRPKNNDDENVISKQFDTSYPNVGIGSIFAGTKGSHINISESTTLHSSPENEMDIQNTPTEPYSINTQSSSTISNQNHDDDLEDFLAEVVNQTHGTGVENPNQGLETSTPKRDGESKFIDFGILESEIDSEANGDYFMDPEDRLKIVDYGFDFETGEGSGDRNDDGIEWSNMSEGNDSSGNSNTKSGLSESSGNVNFETSTIWEDNENLTEFKEFIGTEVYSDIFNVNSETSTILTDSVNQNTEPPFIHVVFPESALASSEKFSDIYTTVVPSVNRSSLFKSENLIPSLNEKGKAITSENKTVEGIDFVTTLKPNEGKNVEEKYFPPHDSVVPTTSPYHDSFSTDNTDLPSSDHQFEFENKTTNGLEKEGSQFKNGSLHHLATVSDISEEGTANGSRFETSSEGFFDSDSKMSDDLDSFHSYVSDNSSTENILGNVTSITIEQPKKVDSGDIPVFDNSSTAKSFNNVTFTYLSEAQNISTNPFTSVSINSSLSDNKSSKDLIPSLIPDISDSQQNYTNNTPAEIQIAGLGPNKDYSFHTAVEDTESISQEKLPSVTIGSLGVSNITNGSVFGHDVEDQISSLNQATNVHKESDVVLKLFNMSDLGSSQSIYVASGNDSFTDVGFNSSKDFFIQFSPEKSSEMAYENKSLLEGSGNVEMHQENIHASIANDPKTLTVHGKNSMVPDEMSNSTSKLKILDEIDGKSGSQNNIPETFTSPKISTVDNFNGSPESESAETFGEVFPFKSEPHEVLLSDDELDSTEIPKTNYSQEIGYVQKNVYSPIISPVSKVNIYMSTDSSPKDMGADTDFKTFETEKPEVLDTVKIVSTSEGDQESPGFSNKELSTISDLSFFDGSDDEKLVAAEPVENAAPSLEQKYSQKLNFDSSINEGNQRLADKLPGSSNDGSIPLRTTAFEELQNISRNEQTINKHFSQLGSNLDEDLKFPEKSNSTEGPFELIRNNESTENPLHSIIDEENIFNEEDSIVNSESDRLYPALSDLKTTSAPIESPNSFTDSNDNGISYSTPKNDVTSDIELKLSEKLGEEFYLPTLVPQKKISEQVASNETLGQINVTHVSHEIFELSPEILNESNQHEPKTDSAGVKVTNNKFPEYNSSDTSYTTLNVDDFFKQFEELEVLTPNSSISNEASNGLLETTSKEVKGLVSKNADIDNETEIEIVTATMESSARGTKEDSNQEVLQRKAEPTKTWSSESDIAPLQRTSAAIESLASGTKEDSNQEVLQTKAEPAQTWISESDIGPIDASHDGTLQRTSAAIESLARGTKEDSNQEVLQTKAKPAKTWVSESDITPDENAYHDGTLQRSSAAIKSLASSTREDSNQEVLQTKAEPAKTWISEADIAPIDTSYDGTSQRTSAAMESLAKGTKEDSNQDVLQTKAEPAKTLISESDTASINTSHDGTLHGTSDSTLQSEHNNLDSVNSGGQYIREKVLETASDTSSLQENFGPNESIRINESVYRKNEDGEHSSAVSNNEKELSSFELKLNQEGFENTSQKSKDSSTVLTIGHGSEKADHSLTTNSSPSENRSEELPDEFLEKTPFYPNVDVDKIKTIPQTKVLGSGDIESKTNSSKTLENNSFVGNAELASNFTENATFVDKIKISPENLVINPKMKQEELDASFRQGGTIKTFESEVSVHSEGTTENIPTKESLDEELVNYNSSLTTRPIQVVLAISKEINQTTAGFESPLEIEFSKAPQKEYPGIVEVEVIQKINLGNTSEVSNKNYSTNASLDEIAGENSSASESSDNRNKFQKIEPRPKVQELKNNTSQENWTSEISSEVFDITSSPDQVLGEHPLLNSSFLQSFKNDSLLIQATEGPEKSEIYGSSVKSVDTPSVSSQSASLSETEDSISNSSTPSNINNFSNVGNENTIPVYQNSLKLSPTPGSYSTITPKDLINITYVDASKPIFLDPLISTLNISFSGGNTDIVLETDQHVVPRKGVALNSTEELETPLVPIDFSEEISSSDNAGVASSGNIGKVLRSGNVGFNSEKGDLILPNVTRETQQPLSSYSQIKGDTFEASSVFKEKPDTSNRSSSIDLNKPNTAPNRTSTPLTDNTNSKIPLTAPNIVLGIHIPQGLEETRLHQNSNSRGDSSDLPSDPLLKNLSQESTTSSSFQKIGSYEQSQLDSLSTPITEKNESENINQTEYLSQIPNLQSADLVLEQHFETSSEKPSTSNADKEKVSKMILQLLNKSEYMSLNHTEPPNSMAENTSLVSKDKMSEEILIKLENLRNRSKGSTTEDPNKNIDENIKFDSSTSTSKPEKQNSKESERDYKGIAFEEPSGDFMQTQTSAKIVEEGLKAITKTVKPILGLFSPESMFVFPSMSAAYPHPSPYKEKVKKPPAVFYPINSPMNWESSAELEPAIVVPTNTQLGLETSTEPESVAIIFPKDSTPKLNMALPGNLHKMYTEQKPYRPLPSLRPSSKKSLKESLPVKSNQVISPKEREFNAPLKPIYPPSYFEESSRGKSTVKTTTLETTPTKANTNTPTLRSDKSKEGRIFVPGGIPVELMPKSEIFIEPKQKSESIENQFVPGGIPRELLESMSPSRKTNTITGPVYYSDTPLGEVFGHFPSNTVTPDYVPSSTTPTPLVTTENVFHKTYQFNLKMLKTTIEKVENEVKDLKESFIQSLNKTTNLVEPLEEKLQEVLHIQTKILNGSKESQVDFKESPSHRDSLSASEKPHAPLDKTDDFSGFKSESLKKDNLAPLDQLDLLQETLDPALATRSISSAVQNLVENSKFNLQSMMKKSEFKPSNSNSAYQMSPNALANAQTINSIMSDSAKDSGSESNSNSMASAADENNSDSNHVKGLLKTIPHFKASPQQSPDINLESWGKLIPSEVAYSPVQNIEALNQKHTETQYTTQQHNMYQDSSTISSLDNTFVFDTNLGNSITEPKQGDRITTPTIYLVTPASVRTTTEIPTTTTTSTTPSTTTSTTPSTTTTPVATTSTTTTTTTTSTTTTTTTPIPTTTLETTTTPLPTIIFKAPAIASTPSSTIVSSPSPAEPNLALVGSTSELEKNIKLLEQLLQLQASLKPKTSSSTPSTTTTTTTKATQAPTKVLAATNDEQFLNQLRQLLLTQQQATKKPTTSTTTSTSTTTTPRPTTTTRKTITISPQNLQDLLNSFSTPSFTTTTPKPESVDDIAFLNSVRELGKIQVTTSAPTTFANRIIELALQNRKIKPTPPILISTTVPPFVRMPEVIIPTILPANEIEKHQQDQASLTNDLSLLSTLLGRRITIADLPQITQQFGTNRAKPAPAPRRTTSTTTTPRTTRTTTTTEKPMTRDELAEIEKNLNLLSSLLGRPVSLNELPLIMQELRSGRRPKGNAPGATINLISPPPFKTIPTTGRPRPTASMQSQNPISQEEVIELLRDPSLGSPEELNIYGQSNDAILAAVLKQRGIGPTHNNLPVNELFLQGQTQTRPPYRPTRPPPPPQPQRRPVLDGLAWLWRTWQETGAPGNRVSKNNRQPTSAASTRLESPLVIGAFGGDTPTSATNSNGGGEYADLQYPQNTSFGEGNGLLTAAFSVTRAVSQFLGAAFQGAAKSVQSAFSPQAIQQPSLIGLSG